MRLINPSIPHTPSALLALLSLFASLLSFILAVLFFLTTRPTRRTQRATEGVTTGKRTRVIPPPPAPLHPSCSYPPLPRPPPERDTPPHPAHTPCLSGGCGPRYSSYTPLRKYKWSRRLFQLGGSARLRRGLWGWPREEILVKKNTAASVCVLLYQQSK